MARASFKSPHPDVPVVLELTGSEARALRDLLYGHVGGTGPRRVLLTGTPAKFATDHIRVDGIGIALTDLLGKVDNVTDMRGSVEVS